MFRQEEQQENHFWMSYTDLLTGFLIVFILVMYDLYTQNDEQYAVEGKYSEMNEIIEEELNSINNVTLSDQGTIRFIAEKNKSLFESGEYKITPYFQNLLDKTIPTYLEALHEVYEDTSQNVIIKEVRIEGHTDSEGSYYTNLELSSNRARVIQAYIMKSTYYQKYDWKFRFYLQRHFIACGYSKSIPLDSNAKITEDRTLEDKSKSRRVEFRTLLEYKKEEDEN